jgi:hypothetical protein
MSAIWHHWGLVTAIFAGSVLTALVFSVAFAYLRWRSGLLGRYALAEGIMIAATVPWIWPLLAPNPNPYSDRRVFLVPFTDMLTQFREGPRGLFIDVVGNLMVFAPLGFFLPVRFRVGLGVVLAASAIPSATVETLQYVLDLHRVTSTDDVLLNTAGGVLGALCSRTWWRRNTDRAERGDERRPAPVP